MAVNHRFLPAATQTVTMPLRDVRANVTAGVGDLKVMLDRDNPAVVRTVDTGVASISTLHTHATWARVDLSVNQYQGYLATVATCAANVFASGLTSVTPASDEAVHLAGRHEHRQRRDDSLRSRHERSVAKRREGGRHAGVGELCVRPQTRDCRLYGPRQRDTRRALHQRRLAVSTTP
jgi:hypothetical protein